MAAVSGGVEYGDQYVYQHGLILRTTVGSQERKTTGTG